MAEINLSLIIADYKKGLSVKQLASKYEKSEAELTKAIQKEFYSSSQAQNIS